MAKRIYKPNAKNTGFAFTFNVSPDNRSGDPVLWISAVRQAGWDANSKTGSFKGNAQNAQNSINAKFSSDEAYAIANMLLNPHTSDPLPFFHQSPNGTTKFFLSYDEKEFQGQNGPITRKGFYLNLTRNDNDKFGIGLSKAIEAPSVAYNILNGLKFVEEIQFKEDLARSKQNQGGGGTASGGYQGNRGGNGYQGGGNNNYQSGQRSQGNQGGQEDPDPFGVSNVGGTPVTAGAGGSGNLDDLEESPF